MKISNTIQRKTILVIFISVALIALTYKVSAQADLKVDLDYLKLTIEID